MKDYDGLLREIRILMDLPAFRFILQEEGTRDYDESQKRLNCLLTSLRL